LPNGNPPESSDDIKSAAEVIVVEGRQQKKTLPIEQRLSIWFEIYA
jgi:hypothetical protein